MDAYVLGQDTQDSVGARAPARGSFDLYIYFALACSLTWVLAWPAARAWIQGRAPSAGAVAGAGLSAFGPLLAALAVAGRRRGLGQVFGRWRTNPAWVLLALGIPLTIRALARLLFAASGGHLVRWLDPPSTPEAMAALVVFPLGEEFGWRGFAHPRAVARFGAVRGSLLLGAVWGLWHLVYSITPQAAGFDPFVFGMTMVELPLYALPMAWVFEKSNRSMAAAIAFHAAAHIDHLERAPRSDLLLHILHLAVLLAVAVVAARALGRGRGALSPHGSPP
jgi:membrane protease YdiL (CAAX protease family)